MISTLDLLFRGAGLGAIAVVIILMARQYRATAAGRLGIAFGVAVFAGMLCPLCQLWGVGYWGLPIYLACFAVAGLFWLFVRAWFDDGFRPRYVHWLAIAGLVALHLWRHGGAGVEGHAGHIPDDLTGALNALPYLLDLAFVAAALVRARAGKADDLDEARRRFRDFMVTAIGGYMLLVTGLNIYLFYRRPAPLVDFLILVGTVFLIFAFLIMTGRMQGRLFGTHTRAEPAPAPGAALAEEQLLAALTRFMNDAKGYRQPGLSIAALAERLGSQEYRLRRLINGRLGHRNFSDFVNGYRLAEARRRLADPEAARLPVLTIALDAGFQSIGPFNRAFKDDTGMTPVEFRRAQHGQNGQM